MALSSLLYYKAVIWNQKKFATKAYAKKFFNKP